MLFELPIIDNAGTPAPASTGNEKQWRSMEHLNGDAGFAEMNKGEFAPEATEAPTGPSRRTFMQLMGASMAFAGLAACRRPVENILPYTRQPEEIIPGVPLHYASMMPFQGVAHAVLVESHEGRPNKIEGNPEHPVSQGATSVFAQASILNLYDPDRARGLTQGAATTDWGSFVAFAAAQANSGKRLGVVAGSSSSTTLAALKTQLNRAYADVVWANYDSAGEDVAALGNQLAFGRPYRTQNQFSKAKVIVSLEADFLGSTNVDTVPNSREYAESRRVNSTLDEMSRLYVVESAFSTTGGMADHRLRMKSGDVGAFASALANKLGVSTAGDATYADHKWIEVIAADLEANRGAGVVIAGQNQPGAVHALCALMNRALGNLGSTVHLLDTGVASVQSQTEQLAELTEAVQAGQIDTLLFLNTNPVYDAPVVFDFASLIGKVDHTICVSALAHETAQSCEWHIPASHYLESWGDGRASDGTLSIMQPLIAPLFDSKSEIEVLAAMVSGTDQAGHDLVKAQWRSHVSGNFANGWRKAIHDGFLADSAYNAVASTSTQSVANAVNALGRPNNNLEVVILADSKAFDGEYSNNAWMQELPDFTTKITWDNVAMMSPKTAADNGLGVFLDGGAHYVDVVEVSAGGQSIEIPVWIVPGWADNSIGLRLGYGRSIKSDRETREVAFFNHDDDIYMHGPIANGVGSNVAALRAQTIVGAVQGASIKKVGGNHMLALTQDHHYMGDHFGTDSERPFVRRATMDAYKADPGFVSKNEAIIAGVEETTWDEYPMLWEENHPATREHTTDSRYALNQWGMVIDLNTCNGCNACVVACQSENNIQVVGKDQVSRGRETAWLRLDRYFVGDNVDNPEMVVQPVACQHCENAPCESVCPVAATSHSADGINEMTYNRCIGTRYCANNCPYKVRRFNFYNWSKDLPDTVRLAQNPNVTVRTRGVMEKCSYCVQRVRAAGIVARREDRAIAESDVVTACQQVCPSQAITFGDVADPKTQVAKLKRNERNYQILASLNVKPRTSYMARLRNPNPSLADQA